MKNIIIYSEQLTCLEMEKNYFYCEHLTCSLKFAVSEGQPQGLSLAESAEKGLMLFHKPHICHEYHGLYLWRKFCHVEKFQISVKNLNNLWRFIEIYAVFVLTLCGENLCGEKMTNMRSALVLVHIH